MSQITVSTPDNRVLDAFIVSTELFHQLTSILKANSTEYFTPKLLTELEVAISDSLLDKFNLRDRRKSPLWHRSKAKFCAARFYPWYDELLALIKAIAKLNTHGAELHIKLTSA